MARATREGRKALAVTLLGLVLIALPLESRGLRAWAERLEVGEFRTLALETSESLSSLTEQTLLPEVRTALLDAVATFPGNATNTEPAALAATPAPAAPAAAPQVATATPTEATTDGKTDANTSAVPADPATAATGPVVNALPIIEAKKPAPGEADGPPTTVVLVGDSMMAVGLGPYLTRELATLPGVRVVRAYRSGTGLARPEVFNWAEQYPKLAGGVKPDLVICAMGANDAQDFMLNGKPVSFGSEPWNKEYQKRVDSLVNQVAPGKTPVLWLALPSMRSEKFAKRILQLNDIVKERVSQKESLVWMESNPLLGGGKTTYVEFQKNSKQKLERLRQPDGIHLSDAGAQRIGPSILTWVGQRRDQLRSPQGSSMSAGL